MAVRRVWVSIVLFRIVHEEKTFPVGDDIGIICDLPACGLDRSLNWIVDDIFGGHGSWEVVGVSRWGLGCGWLYFSFVEGRLGDWAGVSSALATTPKLQSQCRRRTRTTLEFCWRRRGVVYFRWRGGIFPTSRGGRVRRVRRGWGRGEGWRR